MNVQKIKLDYKNWKACENNTFEQIDIVKPICNIELLELSTRIGSQSANGQVFRFSLPNSIHVMAIKIIPKVNKKAENEIFLTEIFSILNKSYFPKFYCAKKCFITSPKDNLSYISDINKTNSSEISACFMLLECLSFDLRQIINQTIYFDWNNKTALELVQEICKIIYDFNNLGYFHNDLHIGNIMFRCYIDKKPDIVLIDFGETKKSPKIRDDIWAFFKSFIKESLPISHMFKESYSIINSAWSNYSDLKYIDKKTNISWNDIFSCFQ
jgi:serine/threonine protein kinase